LPDAFTQSSAQLRQRRIRALAWRQSSPPGAVVKEERVMRSLLRRILAKPIKRISVRVAERVEAWRRDALPHFANTPRNLKIELPRTIVHPERIHMGDDVWLGPGCLLCPVSVFPSSPFWPRDRRPTFAQRFDPRIIIGNRVVSTGRLTLGAHQEILIEDDVMFADNVHMTDGLHGFENAEEPYKYQAMFRIAPIVIKRGCWIGQNVVVMPGVTIGELSIIGANSVVTRDIPARSIAVGAPARVIKNWDATSRAWVPVTSAT
jgi:acetyltransferase-like isoleucine patch superfamily enzyme